MSRMQGMYRRTDRPRRVPSKIEYDPKFDIKTPEGMAHLSQVIAKMVATSDMDGNDIRKAFEHLVALNVSLKALLGVEIVGGPQNPIDTHALAS